MKKGLSFILTLVLTCNFFGWAEEQKKELTLKEAIFHALKNNLDLQIQMTDTEISKKSLKINKAIFIPTLEITSNT